ncbi:putative adenylyltransferase/sulfurtransferase MoeZ [compost metagenome]
MDFNMIVDILIVVLIIWLVYNRFGPTKGLITLRDAEFRHAIDSSANRILIDVREPSEFKGGYITGARNIPLSQLRQRIEEIPPNSDVYLYCRSGVRSKDAAKLLYKKGYTKLTHLKGGIGAWSGKLSQ